MRIRETRRAGAALALALALAACGGGHGASALKPPPRPPTVVAGDLDASKLLTDLPERAAALGAGPASIVASGQLSAGERLGAFVEVPEDACLLTYARASTSLEDIDIAVFAEEGNPVAVDEAPDAHPTVLLCPPHPARVYAAVHAASGEGLVALAAQIVPRDQALEVGKALRAHGARGDLPSAEAWPGLAERIAQHRKAIGGTWEEQRRVAVAIDERSPTAVAMPIEAGHCADALVLASEDASMLDVEAVDDEERVVARATDTGKEISLVVCSEAPLRGTLMIRPHIGSGVAAVVVAHTSLALSADLSAATHIVWVPQTLTLPQARAALDAQLAREGYAAPTSSASITAVLGRRTTVPVESTDGCRRVDVLAGAPAAAIHASVWDEKGAALGEGNGASSVTLFACAKGKLSVDVDVRGRGGPVMVVTRKERWQHQAFTAHPLAASRMMFRAAEGAVGAMEGTASQVRELSLDSSRRETWETTVPAGACVLSALGVEGEGTGVAMTAIDVGTGEVLDRGAAQRATAVRACAAPLSPRKVRVEVRATAGKLDGIAGERVRPGPTP